MPRRVTFNLLLIAVVTMQRLKLFILILTIAAGVLLILVGVSWYLAVTSQSFYQSSWMGQMWGGMMGRGGMMEGGSTTVSFLWMVPVVLIGAVLFAVIGISFYLIFPEIRSSKSACVQSKSEQAQPATSSTDSNSKVVTLQISDSATCEVLLKTMTPDEQKVLSVLRAHKGKYLQKYIGKEAGLNRLQTHRIIARFAQRGIVNAKPFGNTNEISLSDWVQTSEIRDSNKVQNAQ
jgi:hypothetical protein